MLQIVLTAKDLDRIEEIIKNQEPRFFRATFKDGKELDLVNKHDFDKLSNNWNELKEWLNNKWKQPFSEISISDIVNKMREIEEDKKWI